MGGKSWTPEEDARLKEVFERGDNIARSVEYFPGRTYDGIKVRATRIGVVHADYRSWTPEEDEILRDIWTTPLSIKAGMHRLERRSYDAAKIRALRLRLGAKTPAEKGTRSWVLRAVKAVLAKGVHMSMSEIAEATGVDRKSIQDVISNHHGKTFYVADWKRVDTNHLAMKWAIGTGPDAPKPPPKSPLEYWKGYRDRKRIARGAFNPFATVSGEVVAPTGRPGRVYHHMWDEPEEQAA